VIVGHLAHRSTVAPVECCRASGFVYSVACFCSFGRHHRPLHCQRSLRKKIHHRRSLRYLRVIVSCFDDFCSLLTRLLVNLSRDGRAQHLHLVNQMVSQGKICPQRQEARYQFLGTNFLGRRSEAERVHPF
jgi:hypothetical protein